MSRIGCPHSFNTLNGVGVTGDIGPGIGAGFSAGVDVCYMKVIKCWNTPGRRDVGR